MKINISSKNENLIVIPTYKKNETIEFFSTNKNKKIKEKVIEKVQFFKYKSESEEILLTEVENKKILLIGLDKNYDSEKIRRVYSSAFNFLKSKKETKFSIEIPEEKEEVIKSVVEGIDLSDYKFDKYITKKEKLNFEITLDIKEKFKPIVNQTLLITKNVKLTRNLVNENSYIMTPKKIESIVKEFAKKNKLSFTSLDEKAIQKEKLNLLWAVGKGSENPPRLILVEYNGDPKSKERIALVGKGITYDTGGTNLKPTGYLEDMKMDMGGAATVLGAFASAVEMKLKKNIVLVISSAENSISSSSFKPGDIFNAYNGTSVEVLNTDAEGRLVLADAISYVQKKSKVTSIIDVATLTGAILVALGPTLIGMFGNDKEMKQSLFDSGEKTFDRVWEFPIYDEHREMIKSDFADLKNIGGRDGGSITAAAFIEKFIEEKVKWVHLDIAGAAKTKKGHHYIPDFGTGIGVRLLVDYLNK